MQFYDERLRPQLGIQLVYDSIHEIAFNCSIAFCHYRDVMTIAFWKKSFLFELLGNYPRK